MRNFMFIALLALISFTACEKDKVSSLSNESTVEIEGQTYGLMRTDSVEWITRNYIDILSGKSFRKLKVPEGWQLPTPREFANLKAWTAEMVQTDMDLGRHLTKEYTYVGATNLTGFSAIFLEYNDREFKNRPMWLFWVEVNVSSKYGREGYRIKHTASVGSLGIGSVHGYDANVASVRLCRRFK